MDTISFSLTTHRGCFGECHFCSIALHEGRTILSRSEASILAEARKIAALPDFKGYHCGRRRRDSEYVRHRLLAETKPGRLPGQRMPVSAGLFLS
ncbi:MAG: hypothetical protein MZV70_26225 [Desulfobacterales bacterium]|nr:hypothetical protein [Desulfobacterales bacterium]